MLRCLLPSALALLVACGGSSSPAPTASPAADPGVSSAELPAPSERPALRLPAGFTPTAYRARLALDPARPDFHGSIEIDGELAAPASTIWLNAQRLSIGTATARVGGDEIALEPRLREPFLELVAPRELPAGPLTIAIDYDGRITTKETYGVFMQEEAGKKYVFTQFEADAARRAFPSVDEPWNKAPWQLTLDVPAGLVALGNAPIASTAPQGDGSQRVVFAETRPLPTYLIAFAVGPFEIVDAGETAGGAPVRIVALAGRSAEAAWAAEVTPKIIADLEDYFGSPYPFAKADSIAIPSTVGFGAMENAGLITYRADILLIDPETGSATSRRRYADIAGHELAHQWFGNLVTPAWWDDLWLNESFASWLEEKVMERFEPSWRLDVPVVVERDESLHADGLVTARRVHQPVETDDDLATAFDGITYGKGASVIRMIEAWVGPEVFRKGVQSYLAEHAWGSGSTANFVAAIDAASELEVTPVFESFIEQSGAPRIGAKLRCEPKTAPVVSLDQQRWLPHGATQPEAPTKWQVPVCIAYGKGKRRTTTCTLLTSERAEVTLEGSCPSWFLPNSGARGYYRMGLTEAAFADLLKHGWPRLSTAERVLVAGDLRAAIDRHELSLGASLDLVPKLVRDGSPFALREAETMVNAALAVADPAQRAELATWIRRVFGARARKLGFLPGKRDGFGDELIRGSLVPLVALAGEDESLRKRAVELAARWQELPDSVQSNVLAAAVRQSAEVRQSLLDVVVEPGDSRAQYHAYRGLGAIVDPEIAAEVLEVLLDPRVDLKQGQRLLFSLSGDVRTQPVVEAFLREHLDVLLARVPAEGTTGGSARLAWVFTAACDADRKDEIESYVRARFEDLAGGTRTVAQVLEGMKVCIDQRAAMRPQLQSWLDAR